jgi:hypothetical protein
LNQNLMLLYRKAQSLIISNLNNGIRYRLDDQFITT